MALLKLAWHLFEFVLDVFLLWLVIYSFWHGFTFKTGNFNFELYGIARFFNK